MLTGGSGLDSERKKTEKLLALVIVLLHFSWLHYSVLISPSERQFETHTCRQLPLVVTAETGENVCYELFHPWTDFCARRQCKK